MITLKKYTIKVFHDSKQAFHEQSETAVFCEKAVPKKLT